MERLARGGLPVEIVESNPVRILVAGPPDVAEDDVLLRVGGLVDDLEAVALEVGPHVVEITVAAVDEGRGVAVCPQHGAGREQPGVARPLDHALPGARRQTEGQGFKTADGTVAGRVEVVEHKALLHQGVQVRSQSVRVAVGRKEVGAQALHDDQYDVLPDGRHGIPYSLDF